MKFLALIASTIAALTAATAAKVDSDIFSALENGQNPDIIVHLPEYEGGMRIQQRLTRSERRVLARKVRGEHNKKYQEKVIEVLENLGVEYKPLWIINGIIVRGVNAEIVEKLQVLPEVTSLEADKEIARIHDPMVHHVEIIPNKRAVEWGVEIINAPNVWNTTQGEGITIANIDTGVRYTHQALVKNYRGNTGSGFNHDYNWFDPRGQKVPFDNNGHGTHTMGTIAGSEATGIGVAPGSFWIAAKGCASSSCATQDLLLSGEYVICPTKQDGTGEDCTKGADIVSNSWGGGQGSTTYLSMVNAWIDAGSVPLFSQGNSGSSCSTANSPGDLAVVIGVGSTDRNDQLSSFSSRGPAVDRAPNFVKQKPDISAPGEQVRSAYYTGDTAYATLSGTSMACPHVAGLSGLILSAFPSMTYEELRAIYEESSTMDVNAPKGGLTTCGGVEWKQKPNYHYGYGRIDATAAFEAARRKFSN